MKSNNSGNSNRTNHYNKLITVFLLAFLIGLVAMRPNPADARHITFASLSRFVQSYLNQLRSDVNSVRDPASGGIVSKLPGLIDGLKMSGNVLDFNGGGADKGNVPQINFNQGETKIYDGGDLHIQTDDYMYLDASKKVTVQNDLQVNGTIYGSVAGTINPGFAQGSVIFQGSNGLESDGNLFWNSTNNRLGIRTSNPQAPLHVFTNNATSTAVVIQGAASQTADLIQWQDSTAAVNASIAADGRLTSYGAELGGAHNSPYPLGHVNGLFLPRYPDLSGTIIGDYQDEAAYLDKRPNTTITLTPNQAASSGTISNIFRDDTSSIVWNEGTSPYPLILEMDMSANPISVSGNGYYAIGMTFRSSGEQLLVNPTHIKIEYWNNNTVAYETVFDDVPTYISDFGTVFTTTRFLSNSTSNNLQKVRITLSGTNPLPVDNIFRIERVIIYHATANWDPWHLHVKGGTVFGPVTLGGDTNVVQLAVKANSAQSANIVEWQNSSGTALSVVNSLGHLGIGAAPPTGTGLFVQDGKYLQFNDNNAGAPPGADCDSDTERGRLSIDTTGNILYVCNGLSRGWDTLTLSD